MESLSIQVQRWMKQADRDLEVARKLFEIEFYDNVAFYAQQAAEKALKAAWMRINNQPAPKTHNIIRLAVEVALPEEYIDVVRLMSGDYMATRYPDMGDEMPAETYTADDATHRIEAAEKVCQWVKEQIQ